MSEYMFDTNIFNRILDGSIDPLRLRGKVCYVTHVQLDEIRGTKDSGRRSKLQSVFEQVRDVELPTESFVLGASRLDAARLGDGRTYDRILEELSRRNKAKPSNVQDALIAETAMANGLTLVTEDGDLRDIITEMRGAACGLQEVLD